MAHSDPLKDLDPKYASALSEVTDGLRREFDRKLSATRAELGLEDALEDVEEAPAATAAPSDPSDTLEDLHHAVVALDAAGSQGEILDSLVAGCARFASRCAVFLVRDGQVAGWTSRGFSRSDGDMRAISFPVEPGTPWAHLSDDAGTIALRGDQCGPICDRLGGDGPEDGLLVPFVLNNQTAAGVYCDRVGADDALDVAALQLLTFIASQVLENLPVRDRASTSTLRLAADAADAATAEPEMPAEAPPEPETATVPEITSPAIEVEIEEDGPDDFFKPDAGADFPEPEPPAPMATAEAPPEPEPEPTAEIPPLGEEPPPPAILSDATTQVQPPSDLEGPGWAFTGGGASGTEGSDESQHEEARRLARLLVTEVKLYNEELVEKGRQKGDVYSVLREDIDRSRQIFEDRIAEDVRADNDYFHEALVRILAGGDPSVLGA